MPKVLITGSSSGIGALSAHYVSKVAIRGMMRKKAVIVPGFTIKCMRLLSKILPEAVSVRIMYKIQNAKKI